MMHKSLEYNHPCLQSFIDKFPKVDYEDFTVLDIAGVSNLEKTYHQFYAHYLYDHTNNFSKLFMQCLGVVINRTGKKFETFSKWDIKSEVVTTNNNRLDLLLIGNDNLSRKNILIEVKWQAELYNDLSDYWDAFGSLQSVGIVLSIKPMVVEDENWVNITHYELIKELKSQYNQKRVNFTDYEHFVLQEFIKTIEMKQNYMHVKNVDLGFYEKNRAVIQQIIDYNEQTHQQIYDAFENLAFKQKKKTNWDNSKATTKVGVNYLYTGEFNAKQHIGLDVATYNLESGLFAIGFDLLGSAVKHYKKLKESNRLNDYYKSDKRYVTNELVIPDKYACLFYKEYGVEDLQDLNDLNKSFIHLYNIEWKPILDMIKEELLKLKK